MTNAVKLAGNSTISARVVLTPLQSTDSTSGIRCIAFQDATPPGCVDGIYHTNLDEQV